MSGALPTIWSSLHDWQKGEQRAVLQPFNVLVLGIVMLVFGWRGLLHQDVWIAVTIALPSSVISAQLGVGIFWRLTESQIRQILIWLILSSVIVLVGRELVAWLAATG